MWWQAVSHCRFTARQLPNCVIRLGHGFLNEHWPALLVGSKLASFELREVSSTRFALPTAKWFSLLERRRRGLRTE